MNELAEHLERLGFEPSEADGFAPVPAAELASIERRYGPLPTDYRSFLNEAGGAFFPGLARVGGRSLGLIYGGTAKRGLTSRVAMYDGRVPPTMIPIADGRGDQFVLDVSGPDQGAVFHWDHHREPDVDEYLDRGVAAPQELLHSNLTRVARSCADFVRSIWVQAAAE